MRPRPHRGHPKLGRERAGVPSGPGRGKAPAPRTPGLTLNPTPPFLQHKQASMRAMTVNRPEKDTATTAREDDQDSSLSGAPSAGGESGHRQPCGQPTTAPRPPRCARGAPRCARGASHTLPPGSLVHARGQPQHPHPRGEAPRRSSAGGCPGRQPWPELAVPRPATGCHSGLTWGTRGRHSHGGLPTSPVW